MLKKVSLCKWTRITIMTVAFIVLISCQKAPDQTDSTVSILLMSSESLLSSEIDSNTGEDESSQKDEVSSQFVSSKTSSLQTSSKTSSQNLPVSSKEQPSSQAVSSQGQVITNDVGKTVTTDYGFTATFLAFRKKSDTEYEVKFKIKLEADYIVGDHYLLKAKEHIFLVDADRNPVAADNAYASDGQSILGQTVNIGESLEMTVIFKAEKGFNPVKVRYMYDERGFKKVEFTV